MSTLKQVEANRSNAEKSTGPKEASFPITSQNALKTGLYAKSLLIRGEKQEDFDLLTLEYHSHYQPQTPEEREYVDMLIRDAWRLRRFDAVEAQLWEYAMTCRGKYLDGNSALGDVFITENNDQKFARLQRMIAATRRTFKESLHELERLQKQRAEAQEAQNRATHPEKQTDPRSPIPDPLENGFVSSKPSTKPSPSPEPKYLNQSLAPNPQSPGGAAVPNPDKLSAK